MCCHRNDDVLEQTSFLSLLNVTFSCYIDDILSSRSAILKFTSSGRSRHVEDLRPGLARVWKREREKKIKNGTENEKSVLLSFFFLTNAVYKLTKVILVAHDHLLNHLLLALDDGRVVLGEFAEERRWLRTAGGRARSHPEGGSRRKRGVNSLSVV